MINGDATLAQEVAVAITRWNPPTKPSTRERFILKRCRRNRRLFAFLREHRHELFDDELQTELEAMYRDTGAGKEPVPPALMAMALILQGYHRVSDAEAVELTVVDLRWQMVLDRVGAEEPAFSQGALFDFRERMIAADMDKRMLERTARVARSSKGFDARKLPKTLRVAVDSSPLEGAGRVEDSINLIAHAARKVVDAVADILEVDFDEVCQRAGIPLLKHSSVKKALDRDWSDPQQQAAAIDELARQVLSLERWIDEHLADALTEPKLDGLLRALDRLVTQDLEPDPDGGGVRIADGVVSDRQISVEDPQMRHGRKTKSRTIKGYKRHVATDLDRDAIVSCVVMPANQAEHEALPVVKADLRDQGLSIDEVHFDLAYLGSPAVAEILSEGGKIVSKPWPTRNGDRFTKEDFQLDLDAETITCPNGITLPVILGQTVSFPAGSCESCELRASCTTSTSGRSVHIASNESLLMQLREALASPGGRERLRERVAVEHSLAHVSQRQGHRARYRGVRKNTFDLRRTGAIMNLEITQRKAA